MNEATFHERFGAAYGERFTAGLVGKVETDRRLGAHLCVWCARKLRDSGPSDMFCNQEHTANWTQARLVAQGAKADVDGLASSYGEVDGPEPQFGFWAPGEGETAPGWLGDRRNAHERYEAEPPPLGLSAEDAGQALPEGFDFAAFGRIVPVHARPGVLTTEPTERAGDAWRIGMPTAASVDAGGRLLRLDPEVAPDRPFPSAALRTMTKRGSISSHPWRLAATGGPEPHPPWSPLVTCSRCGESRVPSMAPFTSLPPGEDVPRMYTRMWCPGCNTPHQGVRAGIVPLWRDMRNAPPGLERGIVEFALLHPSGQIVSAQVTHEALLHRSNVAAQYLWAELYERLAYVTHPYACPVPACGGASREWVLLTTSLQWEGCLWRPEREGAMRMGLCDPHFSSMRRQSLMDSDHLYMSVGREVSQPYGRARVLVP